MREIKFRAWDTIDNAMVVHDKIINPVQTEAPDGINCFILMQFTGLKDVNDKEIYEGDIVKISDGWPFREFELCVIEYHKYGIPYIIQRYLKNRPGTGDYNFDFLKDAYASGINSYYEVIGNIYETPELLK